MKLPFFELVSAIICVIFAAWLGCALALALTN